MFIRGSGIGGIPSLRYYSPFWRICFRSSSSQFVPRLIGRNKSHHLQPKDQLSNHKRLMKLKFYTPLLYTAREGVTRQFLPVRPSFRMRTNGSLRFLEGHLAGPTSKKPFVYAGPNGLTAPDPWRRVARAPKWRLGGSLALPPRNWPDGRFYASVVPGRATLQRSLSRPRRLGGSLALP